ncbi:MAG: nickel pincer cofactor biosynthesis protein LarB [Endomicrobium sp.]|jgi:NCAIR mutase (PurE)-related protein|nr:nickel pincer cofactor biosynthesis protein LarB [Endomicrobium sp.]
MKKKILKLLKKVKDGIISPNDALLNLRIMPFEDLKHTNIDYHRALRQGYSEIIYGENKTAKQIKDIVLNMLDKGLENIIITRIPKSKINLLIKKKINFDYYSIAKLAVIKHNKKNKLKGSIVIASAGTSDMRISEEAAITSEVLGSKVTRLYDIGVAGIHRILANYKVLINARVIVVVAGMDGALASVIGGLVNCPIIAVPTSIGYGANFNGICALLTMLNSCATGVSVVNIDAGFCAGYIANRINIMDRLK